MLPADLKNQIQKAFGGKSWKKLKSGKNTLIEGEWEKGNRFLRYIIHESEKEVIVSFATMRKGFKDS